VSELHTAGKIPDTTIRSVLVRLNPDALRQILHRQVRSAHRSKQLRPVGLPFGVVAIDGKYMPTLLPGGELAQDQGDKWMLRTMTCSLVSAAAPVVMDAVPVPATTNEMGNFPKVTDELHTAYGRHGLIGMLTADAGMTSSFNADCVRAKGWDYLFALKETQPTLLDEAHRLLGPNRSTPPDAETTDLRPARRQPNRRRAPGLAHRRRRGLPRLGSPQDRGAGPTHGASR